MQSLQSLKKTVYDNREPLARVEKHADTMVVSNEGVPMCSTFDNTTTLTYATSFTPLIEKFRSSVRDIDVTDDLIYLRIKTKKNEILIAPEKEFVAIVVQ